MSDGDSVALHRFGNAHDDAPRLLVLHGLEGSARSHYAVGLAARAAGRGWNTDIMTFRGCGGEPNRARRFYHSGETSDLARVIADIRLEFPRSPLLPVGFSLGGNVLLKWLGERGESAGDHVRAAATVSVPYDLARGARHLQSGFARIYERNFLKSLRRKALAKRDLHDDLPGAGELASLGTLEAFDDLVTARVHGFASGADYYAQSSSLGWLSRIRVPTLLLSARDDPFLPEAVLDEVQREVHANSVLHMEVTRHGGHCGFVGGPVPWRAEYYAENLVLDFLGRFATRIPATVAPG
jgi:uncharacterized protein